MEVKVLNYFIINKEEVQELLLSNRVPCERISINKGIFYYFYAPERKRIYGLYRLRYSSENYYYLERNHFQSLSFFSISSREAEKKLGDARRILNFFLAENEKKSILFLSIKELVSAERLERKRYEVMLTSEIFPSLNIKRELWGAGGERHFGGDGRSFCLEEAIGYMRSELEEEVGEVSREVRFLGEQIYEYFFGVEEVALHLDWEQIDRIKIKVPFGFPLSLLYDKRSSSFPYLEKLTLHQASMGVRKKEAATLFRSSNKLRSFVLFSNGEEGFMEREVEVIERRFLKKKRKHLTALFLKYKTVAGLEPVLREMHRYDFAHFIYHGEANAEAFRLRLGDKSISFSRLQTYGSPRVLFMACCYSEAEPLIEWFFERGGNTLIVFQGKMISNDFHIYSNVFYWQLLSNRKTIKEAFFSTQKKMLRDGKANAFKIRLYGSGEESFYFYENENF